MLSPNINRLLTFAKTMFVSCLLSCATQYRFTSNPDGAAVYQNIGGQKLLLGETPIEYAKTDLPAESPFLITFEKVGFEAREIAISPTDNSLTSVSVQLLPKNPGGIDPAPKKLRIVIKKIFHIQELIFKRRFVDALSELKQLEKDEVELPEVFIMKGSLYLLLDDKTSAAESWKQALKMDPTLDDIKVRLLTLSEKIK